MKMTDRKLIPRSPVPIKRLPKCSAITKAGKQCSNAIAGRDALERIERLDHEHAGAWCAFHILGARVLSEKGNQAHREKRAEARRAAVEREEHARTVAREESLVIDLDAEPEPEQGPSRPPLSVYDVPNFAGPYLGQLTPEQRRTVLRARLRG